jgi:hypothetical protein
MKRRRYWEIGGFLAGGLLIVFGIVAIFMGVNGYNTTRTALKDEGITLDEGTAALDRAGQFLSAHLARAERVTGERKAEHTLSS